MFANKQDTHLSEEYEKISMISVIKKVPKDTTDKWL